MKLKKLAFSQIIFASLFFATIPIFSTLLSIEGISSLEQSVIRLIFSSAILFAFIYLSKTKLHFNRKDSKLFFLYGFFISMSFFSYLSSISLGTPVGEAVFLTYTQPIFAIILAKIFLSERIDKSKILAILLSVLGVVLIIRLWEVKSFGLSLLGDIFAISNGFFYAAYIVVGRYFGTKGNYNHFVSTFWSFTFGAFWLFLLSILSYFFVFDKVLGNFSFSLSEMSWIYLIGLSAVSTVIPYILLNSGLKRISASNAGIILLVEPVFATILGALIFHQILTLWHLLGSMLIALSVFIVYHKK